MNFSDSYSSVGGMTPLLRRPSISLATPALASPGLLTLKCMLGTLFRAHAEWA